MNPVSQWVTGLPRRADRTTVVAIDGRSGSGKTALAKTLADELTVPVFHVEDLYPGWDGLVAGVRALREWVLEPLSAGRPARWRKWDWELSAYGKWRVTSPGPLLMVEGVGCGAAELAPHRAGLVWVETPEQERKARALARDGETYAPHWERWARQEDAFYAADDVSGHADLIVDFGMQSNDYSK